MTPLHALELAAEAGIRDVEVLGVTRAYATRHGAGPLPTHDAAMTAALADPGNPMNAWQGAMRAGSLDLVLLRYAAEVGRVDGLAVNGLDQLPARVRICMGYRGVGRLAVPRTLREQEALTRTLSAAEPVYEEVEPDALLERLQDVAPLRLLGRGPTAADREEVLTFQSGSDVSASRGR